MEHLFVPVELASIAKEKGFDEPCLAYYNNKQLRGSGAILFDVDGLPDNTNYIDIYCAAPLYQQLVDWFREKHGLFIIVNPAFGFVIKNKISNKTVSAFVNQHNKTFYEALQAALTHAFTLI